MTAFPRWRPADRLALAVVAQAQADGDRDWLTTTGAAWVEVLAPDEGRLIG